MGTQGYVCVPCTPYTFVQSWIMSQIISTKYVPFCMISFSYEGYQCESSSVTSND